MNTLKRTAAVRILWRPIQETLRDVLWEEVPLSGELSGGRRNL
jgi:hypothetical protein